MKIQKGNTKRIIIKGDWNACAEHECQEILTIAYFQELQRQQ